MKRRIIDIEGLSARSESGDELGSVEHVLFHPSEPRVVGLMIAAPNVAYVVKRQPFYAGLDSVTIRPDSVLLAEKKPRRGARAAAALGHDPDITVIWKGMRVAGPSGEPAGVVRDVEFDEATGAVTGLTVSAGLAGDMAHGTLAVPAADVVGFESGAVRLAREAGDLEASGGIAKGAAAAAVAVEKRAREVATGADAVGDGLGEVTVAAGYVVGRTAAKVKGSKAAKKVGSAFKGLADAFREGMKDDE